MSFKRSNRSSLFNLYLPLQLIGFLVFMSLCAVRTPESASGSTFQDSGSRPAGIYDQSAPGNGNNQDAEFSPQNIIQPFTTFFDTDFTTSGFGGMRGVGTGTITIAGVSGSVTTALLFWHGPTNSSDPAANANVLFNGTAISGGNIGFSADNFWSFQNSQAYMADVTSLVSGNGSYTLANFRNATSEINGASLIVFFTDGNSANDRDVVLFIGNDSNQANQFDSAGWNVTLAGINYTSGNANLQLHVSDGQTGPDDAILLNGNTLVATGPIFSGGTTDHGSGCCGDPGITPQSGYLWDIRTFDITSFLSPGQNTISMTSGLFGDFLSLIVAAIDLPAGAAPTPCALNCPPDIVRTNDPGECGATVNYDLPDVPSNCGVVTCMPIPGSFFEVGTHTVRCSLPTNPDGPVTLSCSFTVTIVDTEPLRLTCPLETRVDCPGVVDYDLPEVIDNCPNVDIICLPPPGTSFPVGNTVVNCSATAENGNTERCSFRIVVADSSPPTITSCPTAPIALPNPTGACTVALGNVTGSVDATDGCSSGPVTKTQSPAAGTLLAAGQSHPVTVFVSDAAGNSRQCVVMVTVGAAGAPTAVISPSDGTLNLGSVSLFGNQKKKKKKVKQAVATGSFTVRNQGCGNLVLSRRSLLRQIGGMAKNEDDDILSITVDGQEFTTVQIAPDETKTFNVRFSPVIPGLSSCPAGSNLASCLSASDVVPNDYRAVLSFNETSTTVTINATVARGMKLIDPDNPSSTNPVVTLCRSGDQFTVVYYLYSSDLSDIRSVKYEFMDNSGSIVNTIDGVDLAGPISRAGLINGMSFKVTHSFTGAEDNSDVTRVKVTVTGGSSQASATSSSAGSSCGASAQSFRSMNGVTLALPVRRLKGFEN